MTTDSAADTKTLFDRHLQAAMSGDMQTLMLDYTEDSVILTPNGPVVGKTAIEALFRDVILPMLNEDFMKGFNLRRMDIENDTVYLLWEAPGIPVGVDVFVYRDGHIISQAFAMHATS